jgi:glycosyltransferase involved in cell wall biosynthesis
MKLISIVTPCFNEEENVVDLYTRMKTVFADRPQYQFEHIFIDNASTDRTVPLLKEIAAQDKRLKIIVNSRNFGTVRSPFHGILQARGDAVVFIAADLQEPVEMIPRFLEKWEEGFRIVVGIKKGSEESKPMFALRKLYYRVVGRLAEVELINDFTGFGLYDRRVIGILRDLEDPYPYLRGLISEIGFQRAEIEYLQPVRRRGITKNNFYALYDVAMLGMTNHSKVPLRLATMLGFTFSIICLLIATAYLVAKLIFWNTYTIGTAPVIVGLFFFASIQLMFTGILGEYIGSIHTKVFNRPLVVEKERINFD